MGGTSLSKTVQEKVLGVSMNANMKVSEQCRIAASKGNQVLGMIRRNITYKEKSLIVPLYKAIIIMAEMAVFYVAGYLIEERRRWPVITASPRGQCSK